MSETVRGRALIINYNFPDSSQLTRTGSEVDVKNIEAVLKGLNFEVDVKDDKTAEVDPIILLQEKLKFMLIHCHV